MIKYFSGVPDDQSAFDIDCPTGDFDDCKQNWNYEDLPAICKSFIVISSENQVKVLINLLLLHAICTKNQYENCQIREKHHHEIKTEVSIYQRKKANIL